MKYEIDSREEREYLAGYRIDEYERPSLAADIVAFAVMKTGEQNNIRKLEDIELKVLLIKRGQFPYKGHWALPGGFVRPGERVEETAMRELKEETGLKDVYLHLANVYSGDGRDPRGWIVSNTYMALLDGKACELRADTDAWEAAWFSAKLSTQDIEEGECHSRRHILHLSDDRVSGQSNKDDSDGRSIDAVVTERLHHRNIGEMSVFEIEESGQLAFDHAEIIVRTLLALREKMEDRYELAFELLPKTFTLTHFQNVVEKVLDRSLLTANFRRKIADTVVETQSIVEGEGHRPAKLFKQKL